MFWIFQKYNTAPLSFTLTKLLSEQHSNHFVRLTLTQKLLWEKKSLGYLPRKTSQKSISKVHVTQFTWVLTIFFLLFFFSRLKWRDIYHQHLLIHFEPPIHDFGVSGFSQLSLVPSSTQVDHVHYLHQRSKLLSLLSLLQSMFYQSSSALA